MPVPLSWPHTFEAERCATIRLPAPLSWPHTFEAGRRATIRLSALLLTRARLWLGIVRRFGCPRHYLTEHVLGWALYRASVARATTLAAYVWGWALCGSSVARADTWLHALSQTVYAHSTPARHSLTSCPACPLFLLNAPARHSGFPMRRHASPVANRLPAIPRRPATPHMPADAPAHSPARPAS